MVGVVIALSTPMVRAIPSQEDNGTAEEALEGSMLSRYEELAFYDNIRHHVCEAAGPIMPVRD